MENNQTKAYQTPYGSSVIPTNGVKKGEPGGQPSVIPGAIGVAGTKVSVPQSSTPKETSSFGQLFDSFVEALVDRVSDRIVDRAVEKIEAAGYKTTVEVTASIPADVNDPMVLSSDYVSAMASKASLATLGDGPIPPAAAEAHAKLQQAIQALGSSQVRWLRTAPQPPAFQIGGDGIAARRFGGVDPDNMAGVEYTFYASEYNSERFPVTAAPGKYMVLVNGTRLGVDRERLAELDEQIAQVGAELAKPSQERADALRQREATLIAERARTAAGEGLALDAIVGLVRAALEA